MKIGLTSTENIIDFNEKAWVSVSSRPPPFFQFENKIHIPQLKMARSCHMRVSVSMNKMIRVLSWNVGTLLEKMSWKAFYVEMLTMIMLKNIWFHRVRFISLCPNSALVYVFPIISRCRNHTSFPGFNDATSCSPCIPNIIDCPCENLESQYRLLCGNQGLKGFNSSIPPELNLRYHKIKIF